MTKPTGRPRGRPKTKEYVTLMARVPQDLADQAQRYAGQHRQTMSDVLRDGLHLLLEEDRYRPFMSDINTVSENTSDIQAASSPLVSDMKEAFPDNASDINGEIAPAVDMAEASTYIPSDVKAAQSYIASDTKKARQRKRTKRDNVSDMNAETDKESDIKEDSPDILSDVKERDADMASDMQEDTSSLAPDSTAAQSSLASDTHEEASTGPTQPMQPPEPEPTDRDSIEWRRWAVLEQVRTAQAPATPGDIARQIGSTSTLVRHDLEHWRQQGRVQRAAQGGYVSRRAS